MKNEKGYSFIKTDSIEAGKYIISSKSIKYSKLEWAWRIGITVAVITFICMNL